MGAVAGQGRDWGCQQQTSGCHAPGEPGRERRGQNRGREGGERGEGRGERGETKTNGSSDTSHFILRGVGINLGVMEENSNLIGSRLEYVTRSPGLIS